MPPVENAETLQPEESIGADPLEDTIRETWKGMQSDGQIGSEETAESAIGKPEAEPETPATGPERDEHGKFKAKEGDAETTAETEQETESEQEGEQAEGEQEETEPGPYDTPPSSWKKEAAADWSLIPAGVRQEIHRREQNMLDGIQQYKGAADFGQTIYKEFQPYEPLMRSLNTNPQEAVKVMLNQEYVLRQGTPEQKGQLIAEAIKTYGIDPNLVRLEQGGQQEIPPEIQQYLEPFQQKVSQLEQTVSQQQQHAQQAQQAALNAQRAEVTQEVDQFRSELDDSGKPKYPHYDAVRQDMAALIANGRATDLKDAYDKATWANPEVRAKLISAQKEAERKAAAKKAAEAKKAAAANVQDQGSLPGKEETGTMEDTIRTTLRKINSGDQS